MTVSILSGQLKDLRARFTAIWCALNVSEFLLCQAREEELRARGEPGRSEAAAEVIRQPRARPLRIVHGGRDAVAGPSVAEPRSAVPVRAAPTDDPPDGVLRPPR